MGRWTTLEGYLANAEFISKEPEQMADKLNSDYDAYEARIAELQRRLDAIVAIANKLPDKLYVYREFAGVTYKDRSAKDELIAIAEGQS